MAELDLPVDLKAFLQSEKQLQYDATQVEYSELNLKSLADLQLSQVEVELYYTPLVDADPNAGEPGWYVVPSVVLTLPCMEYLAVQLLWLPAENLYGIYDIEHRTLQVFSEAKWADIANDPVSYLNAPWDTETRLMTYFDPSLQHEFKIIED